MDCERQFEFFKNHENWYMRLLCITDLEYGVDDQETCEFRSIFAPKQAMFGKP
jgi:hypothetical protein